MAYQVIARKYRPQRFGDVVGQEHVTRTLANAIAQKRIAHAYLFCGPRGTGKTTVARIFAKCLNCTGGPKVEFPDDDPRCAEIAEGRSLDVFEIDGASNRGIDEIRELRETARYAPASSQFKIYIIDEVHMLTKEAFNALLKTLEEPPAHVKFMFATTEPEKVLPTILSRCQRFDLRRIPTALIVKHLATIARLEKVAISDTALYAIGRGADGGMRDAESALDQLISFCGERIEEEDVLSMFGLTAQGEILSLFEGVLSGQAEPVLRAVDALCRNGKDPGRLLSDLLGHCRNLMLYQVTRGDLSLLQVSEMEAQALKPQAALASREELTRVLEVLTESEARLRDATSRRIVLEVALLKAIEARQSVSLDQVLQRLTQLRGAATEPTTPAPAPTAIRLPRPDPSSTTTASDPPPSPAPPTPPAPLAAPAPGDLQALWASLIEAVGRQSQFLKSYLAEAQPLALEGGVLTIGFAAESAEHLDLVNTDRNRALIQTRLAELGVAGAQVRFAQAHRPTAAATDVKKTTPPTAPPPPKPAPAVAPGPKAKTEPVPFSKDDFKNDPLIQKALEVFKAQIVDVRA